MFQYQYDPTGGPSGSPGGDGRSFLSVFKLVALVVGIGFMAALVLGFSFWALGWAFHVAFFLLRIAFFVWLGCFIWRRVLHRRRRYDRHFDV